MDDLFIDLTLFSAMIVLGILGLILVVINALGVKTA